MYMEAELLIRWYVCIYFVALLPLFTVQVLLRITSENTKMQEASYSASLNWQRNGVNSRQLMLWSIVYYCVLICKDGRGREGSMFSLWLLFYYCKSLNERCILKKEMNEWRQEKNEHMYTIELNSILTLICAHMQSITVIWAENFNEATGSLAPIFYFVFMGLAPLNLKLFWKSATMSVLPKCPNSFCLFV